ncbi:MAG: ADP-ribosylglycohydrolase family protein [Microbacteriaceae bacterium]
MTESNQQHENNLTPDEYDQFLRDCVNEAGQQLVADFENQVDTLQQQMIADQARAAAQAEAPAHDQAPDEPQALPKLDPLTLDRAIGAIIASAAGDALGSQYEFGPALADDVEPQFGRGIFGHDPGEWTDDTSMAVAVLYMLSRGRQFMEPSRMRGRMLRNWIEWSRTAKDVGAQTSAVLRQLNLELTWHEDEARAAAKREHERNTQSAGNGSFMRTGPVALGYLQPGGERWLVEMATAVAELTHFERDNADACVLWSLAIRHAILTGQLDVRSQLRWLPEERRNRWAEFIDQAERPGAHPRDFAAGNGWVVRAFQGALAAVAGSTSTVDALQRAVRGGGDTDTVAAIAGALAGALNGGTSVPVHWQAKLHGWPGIHARDLANLAVRAATHGQRDVVGKVDARGDSKLARTIDTDDPGRAPLTQHPHDHGLWLGSLGTLSRLPDERPEISAVVSLCRVGDASPVGRGDNQVVGEMAENLRNPYREPGSSVQVWLIDQPGRNLNLDLTLESAARAIYELRLEGRAVFLHCAEGRSRTAAVAALYSVRYCNESLDQAWADLRARMPRFAPAPFLVDAVTRLVERP